LAGTIWVDLGGFARIWMLWQVLSDKQCGWIQAETYFKIHICVNCWGMRPDALSSCHIKMLFRLSSSLLNQILYFVQWCPSNSAFSQFSYLKCGCGSHCESRPWNASEMPPLNTTIIGDFRKWIAWADKISKPYWDHDRLFRLDLDLIFKMSSRQTSRHDFDMADSWWTRGNRFFWWLYLCETIKPCWKPPSDSKRSHVPGPGKFAHDGLNYWSWDLVW
jgi:hypothetical protein